MRDLHDETLAAARSIAYMVGKCVDREGLYDYAALALLTHTPLWEAADMLKELGAVNHARGRLLLQAGERELRAAGDVE